MGYGLVAVPRQLWRTADIKGQEKASFHKAGLQADRAIAAKKCVALHSAAPIMPCCLASAAVWHSMQPAPTPFLANASLVS